MLDRYCRLLLLTFPREARDRIGRAATQTLVADSRVAGGRLSWVRLAANSIDVVRAGLAERARRPVSAGEAPRRSLATDFRHARRSLARRPVFTLTVFATLAIGLGLNTAVFSIVNRVLVTELPYRDPSRLAFGWSKLAWVGVPRGWMSGPHIERLRRDAKSIEAILPLRTNQMQLVGAGAPEVVTVGMTTAPLFDVLGVHVLHGRGFVAADEPLNVGIIGYPLWQQRFGGDPSVIGRKVEIGGDQIEIIGVLPQDFRFQVHQSLGGPKPIDLWLPTSWPLATMKDGQMAFAALIRVKPGATLEQAQAEVDVIGAQVDRERFGSHGFGWQLTGVQDDLVKSTRPALLLILGAASLVLLVVCANVTGLLLVRHADRRREFAVRTALGAGRADIVRLVVVECLTLAIAAGLAGLGIAWAALRMAIAANSLPIPRLAEVTIDWRVLAFTLGLSVVAGLAASAMPAWRFTRTQAAGALGDAARGSSRRTTRARSALVVAELALALVLVVASALLVRSYATLRAADPGFNATGTLTADIPLLIQRYPQESQAVALFTEVTERLRAMPGITAVGAVSSAPLDGNTDQDEITPDGWTPPPGGSSSIMVDSLQSTPGYFAAMGIAVVDGRDFTWADRADGEQVAIVDETFARRAWPNGPAVGRAVTIGKAKAIVVGVVRHARQYQLDADDRPHLYRPYAQSTQLKMTLAVRTNDDPDRLPDAVRGVVRSLDERQPVANITTMRHAIDHALADRRLQLQSLGAFAVGAALLAALGLYGLLASLVGERRREIGIRMALGADRGAVRRLVGRQIFAVTATGLGLGLMAALFAARLVAPFLYAISPRDPIAIGTTCAALLGLVAAASYLPLRRATAVDPAEALRTE